MAQNKFYRILSLAVMATVLTALLAVTAFADITGGLGEIDGLEPGKTYTAKPVTINAGGTGIDYVDADADGNADEIDLSTDNNDLAGLYEVYENGTLLDKLVYVYGDISERSLLGERNDDGIYYKTQNTNDFVEGYFTSTTIYTTLSNFGEDGFSTNNQYPTNDDLDDFITEYEAYKTAVAEDPNASDEAVKTAFTKIQTKLKAINIKYALTSKEITPISEVSTYTFKLQEQRGGMKYDDLVMKFVAYIMDKNGDVHKYSYNIAPFDYAYKALSAHPSHTVDFTAASWYAEGSNTAVSLPEDGYLVGFALSPFDGFNDMTKLSAGTRTNHNRFVFTNVSLSVDKPAYPTPVVGVDGTAVTGLKNDVTYNVAPFSINGIDTTEENIKTLTAENNDLATPYTDPVGLYAIYIPEADDFGASDIALVFVQGEERDPLGEKGEDNNLRYQAESEDKFEPGLFTSTTTLGRASSWTATDIFYASTGITNGSMKTYDGSTDTEKQELFTTIQETLKAINIKYALTSKEITPISEVASYTFGLSLYTGQMKYEDLVMKFVAHIMDENGDVQHYSYMTDEQTISQNSSVPPSTVYQHTVDFTAASWYAEGSNTAVSLPEDGYFVGFTLYPFDGVNDYTKLQYSGKNTTAPRLLFYNKSLEYVEPVVEDLGMSLVLDGAIGAKLSFTYDETKVDAATLEITGSDNTTATLNAIFVDDEGNPIVDDEGNYKGYVIVPFNPKDVNTLSYTATLVCTMGEDVVEEVTIEDISVKSYIGDMLGNDEWAEWHDLIGALEVYCNYAENYFSDDEALEALELSDAAQTLTAVPASKDGVIAGVELHSSSLILLDTMTIRHYFAVDTIEGIDVTGATAIYEASATGYAYVDVVNIPAHLLDEQQEVVLTREGETLKINFSVINYVNLANNDETDAKLRNLAIAIANYAAAANAHEAN